MAKDCWWQGLKAEGLQVASFPTMQAGSYDGVGGKGRQASLQGSLPTSDTVSPGPPFFRVSVAGEGLAR